MIIFTQCSKQKKQGGYWVNGFGDQIIFVANPRHYCPMGFFKKTPMKPNKKIVNDVTEYNEKNKNHLGLHKASDLYIPKIYQKLTDAYGLYYVVSAGWGLIRNDFLIPNYDITFNSGLKYSYRDKKTKFPDMTNVTSCNRKIFVFVGGFKYSRFFLELTKNYANQKIILTVRDFKKISGSTRETNWHYSLLTMLCDDQKIIKKLIKDKI